MIPVKNIPSLLQKVNKVTVVQIANSSHFSLRAIGNREIVGFGVGGIPHYIDRFDYPFPAVRFRETKGDIAFLSDGVYITNTTTLSTNPLIRRLYTCVPNLSHSKALAESRCFGRTVRKISDVFKAVGERLREKEKGDWKNLTIDEKKAIYRASFCQTFSEMEAPSGQWKMVAGWVFTFLGVALLLVMGVKKYVYPPLPETFSEEHRKRQLRRMIDTQTNPVTGIASKWDFEKDTWKK